MTKRLSLELRCFRYKVALYLSHMRYSNWLKVVTQSLDSRDLTSGDQLESLQDGHYRLIFYSRYNTVVWKAVRRGTVLSLLPVGNSTTTGDLADKRSSHLLPGKKLSYCKGAFEPVVHHWSRSLIRVRWTSQDVPALSRPCCQTHWSSSPSSSLPSDPSSSPFLLAAPMLVFALLACRHSPLPLELLGVADPLNIP